MNFNKFKLILSLFFSIGFILEAQEDCTLPQQVQINTGSNMTVFVQDGVTSSLGLTSSNPYIVATDGSGNIFGSADISSDGSQSSLSVWGDDAITTEIDGFSSNGSIFYQIIDGNLLYDVNILGFSSSFQSPNNFIANGLSSITSIEILLNCSGPEVELQEDCTLPQQVQINTGSNMTVFVQDGVTSSLGLTSSNPYIVATDGSGNIFGSADISSDGSQSSLSVWGDDAITTEVDGFSSNGSIFYQIIDGNLLYDVNILGFSSSFQSPNNFIANGLSSITSIEVILNCELPNLDGCTDQSACNYNLNATNDDGTCEYADQICDSCVEGIVVDNDSDNDGVCDNDEVLGCTDEDACNYSEFATDNDGSCEYADQICD